MRIPLHNPLQSEVAEAVCQAFLSELHVLLTGRTWKQHGGMGRILPPPPWVRPTHWQMHAGCREDEGGREMDGDGEREIEVREEKK